jgi:hypothetical protein
VTLSTAKEEYISLSVIVCEAMWLHKLLSYLFGQVLDSIIIPRHGVEEGSTSATPSYR